MRMLRLFADASGDTHFDTVEVPMALHDDSPPAKPHYFSDPEPAAAWVFVRCPLGWGGELHPAPRRQIVVCLGGTIRLTTSLGDTRNLTAGTAVLLEDAGSKGHISMVTSKVPFDGFIVRLE